MYSSTRGFLLTTLVISATQNCNPDLGLLLNKEDRVMNLNNKKNMSTASVFFFGILGFLSF
jgi:hypothetical protein